MNIRRILFLLFAFAMGPPLFAQNVIGPFTVTSATAVKTPNGSVTSCAEIDVTGLASVGIVVNGTFSLTLQPQVAIGGQAAGNTSVVPAGSTSSSSQTTVTAAGYYKVLDIAPYSLFRLCPTAYVSGTATIYFKTSQQITASLFGGSGTTYTGTLPIVVSGTAISCPTCGTGTGNVNTSGSPTTNQIAVWASATSIKSVALSGDSTFNGSTGVMSNTGLLSNVLPALSTGFLNWTGSAWAFSAAGSGTVNSGTATQLAIYNTSTAAVSSDALLTDSGTLLDYTGTAGIESPILTANGAGAGLSILSQGADNSSNCPATSICDEAASAGITSYTQIRSPTGPSASSTKIYTALSAAKTTEAFFPLNGNGAGVPTGPTSAVSTDIAIFSGTGGAIADGGILAANLPTQASNGANNQFAAYTGTNKALVPTTMSQDCTLAAGVITCLKTNNVAFGTFATANAATPPAIGGTTPAAGTFTVLTGNTSVTAGVVGTTAGLLNLSGGTSGTATLTAPAVAGTVANAVVSSNNLSAPALVSTVATGTAPLTVSSTTNVANLNASSLSGATMASPGAIGGTTPAAGTFTALACGVAGTTGCVITGAGATSGTATLTWPAVSGTLTNAIASSNAFSALAFTASSTVGGYNLSGSGGNIQLGGHKAFINTAPTIASGFGSGATIPANNGTAAFTVNVGTGGAASSGVITMPAATTGWACSATPNGAPQAAAVTYSAPTSTTSITLTNYTASTGVALAWTASFVLQVLCVGY